MRRYGPLAPRVPLAGVGLHVAGIGAPVLAGHAGEGLLPRVRAEVPLQVEGPVEHLRAEGAGVVGEGGTGRAWDRGDGRELRVERGEIGLGRGRLERTIVRHLK